VHATISIHVTWLSHTSWFLVRAVMCPRLWLCRFMCALTWTWLTRTCTHVRDDVTHPDVTWRILTWCDYETVGVSFNVHMYTDMVYSYTWRRCSYMWHDHSQSRVTWLVHMTWLALMWRNVCLRHVALRLWSCGLMYKCTQIWRVYVRDDDVHTCECLIRTVMRHDLFTWF